MEKMPNYNSVSKVALITNQVKNTSILEKIIKPE